MISLKDDPKIWEVRADVLLKQKNFKFGAQSSLKEQLLKRNIYVSDTIAAILNSN